MSEQHIPESFLWSGVSSGVKRSGRPDLGLAYSPYPATVSGVFTSNSFPAAPVRDASDRMSGDTPFRGLIVNSGVANAATGEKGLKQNQSMIETAAEAMGLSAGEVLASSTGVIGDLLPLDTMEGAIPEAVDQLSEDPRPFAKSILTTDTTVKQVSQPLLGGEGSILGIAKGSGMIRPEMATMLAFLFLDLPVEQNCLDRALSRACDGSFNRITVDGDMSTNDTVLAWAAQLPDRDTIQVDTPEAEKVSAAVEEVCKQLARMIVSDGEGAEKTIEVHVTGAPSEQVARRVADSIAGSSLVKTAFHGEDPNWGRIFSSIGATGENLDPETLTIKINTIPVFQGKPQSPDAGRLDQSMKNEDQSVTVDLGLGEHSHFALTCDLSAEYVRINSEYHT